MWINYSSFVLSTAQSFNHLADCMTMVLCPALSPKFSFVAFFLEDTLTDSYPSVQQWESFLFTLWAVFPFVQRLVDILSAFIVLLQP
jgi:hypothetical protein